MQNYLTVSSLRGALISLALLSLVTCGAERRHTNVTPPRAQAQTADTSSPSQNATPPPTQDANTAPAQDGNGAVTPDPNAQNPNTAPTQNPNGAAPTTPSSGPFAGLAMVGLFDTSTPDVLAFDWPNSALGVRFTGTSLQVNLSDDGTALYSGAPVQSSFNVTVDGGTPTSLRIKAGVSTYTVAQKLAPGEHTLWLSKRTESQVGRSLFRGFVLPGDGNRLATPDLQPRRVVVLGDSESTGYGADANVTAATMCTFDPNLENADYSWPKLLANSLQAEVLNMSFSGKGISRNIVDGDPTTLPILYNRTLASDASSPAPKSWNADVVIVDAGGDDLVGDYDAGTLPSAYHDKYVALLQAIRSREPHAQLYAMLGAGGGPTDRATLRNAAQSVVQTLNQSGDASVHYLEIPVYDGALGYGCDYHPNRATAAELAGKILQQIKPTLGF